MSVLQSIPTPMPYTMAESIAIDDTTRLSDVSVRCDGDGNYGDGVDMPHLLSRWEEDDSDDDDNDADYSDIDDDMDADIDDDIKGNFYYNNISAENGMSNIDMEEEDDYYSVPLLPIFDIKAHNSDMIDLQDLAFLTRLSNVQKERWQHQRLQWEKHLELVFHEDTFNNEYRMSYDAFTTLKDILQPILQRDSTKCRDEDPILTEHVMAMGIRYLKGGTVLDNRRFISMSRSAGYRAIDDFINAVNTAPELDIGFPTSPEEWEEVREGWCTRSFLPKIFHGCVGAMDGKFAPTTKPTDKETGNTISYYSGHYESYGLNCQALVRDDLQFMYFGVVSPGATNDNVSYARATAMKEMIESLPFGLYVVGDAAYTLSERVLVPYTGQDRQDVFHDSFNFYLSQLRIRVEMAFGYMVNKFRILSRRLECSMEKNSAILMACARLHNFIISHDQPFAKKQRGRATDCVGVDDDEDIWCEITPHSSAPLGMSYMPQLPDDTFDEYQGISHTRQSIVDQLEEGNVRRPLYNIERKVKEMEMEFETKSGHIIDRELFSPI